MCSLETCAAASLRVAELSCFSTTDSSAALPAVKWTPAAQSLFSYFQLHQKKAAESIIPLLEANTQSSYVEFFSFYFNF